MESILLPIFICVFLPVSIVLIEACKRACSEHMRTKVLLKAIESNNNIDADKLAASLAAPQKTDKQILANRLLNGCIFSFLGIAAAICGAVWISTFGDYKFAAICFLAAAGCIAIGLGFLVTYFVTRKDK